MFLQTEKICIYLKQDVLCSLLLILTLVWFAFQQQYVLELGAPIPSPHTLFYIILACGNYTFVTATQQLQAILGRTLVLVRKNSALCCSHASLGNQEPKFAKKCVFSCPFRTDFMGPLRDKYKLSVSASIG